MSTPPPPPPAATPAAGGGGAAPSRGFAEAVQVCISKYADFSGRASQSEFWFWTLAVVLASLVANVIDGVLGTGPIVSLLLTLATLVPGLAVSVRRLHDTGRSGMWLLIAFVPIVGFIILIYFYVQPGDPAPNEYG